MYVPFSPLIIDIKWIDYIFSLYCRYKLKKNEIITYSVRSSIDLFFQMKKYPNNSNILVSSINIPNIPDICKYHNLNIIGVDMNLIDISINYDDLLFKINNNKNVTCIIISHLWGIVNNINEIIELCNKNKIDVIEDCAQVYTTKYKGNLKSDMICISYGTIKNCTSFGGSITYVKNDLELSKMNTIMMKYKYMSNIKYIIRCIKYIYIYLIFNNRYINIFSRYLIKILNINENTILNSLRSFQSNNLISSIRRNPNKLLRNIILYRTNNYIDNAKTNQLYFINKINTHCHKNIITYYYKIPSINTYIRTWWLFPIILYKLNRKDILNQLHINNISAHSITSNLIVIDDSCKVSKYIMNNIIYLPIHHLTNKRNIDIIFNVLYNNIPEVYERHNII